jgi:hypothetical protein
MIRQSLPAVKRATYCVMISEPKYEDLPAPVGTGFFVSPDRRFVESEPLAVALGGFFLVG